MKNKFEIYKKIHINYYNNIIKNINLNQIFY